MKITEKIKSYFNKEDELSENIRKISYEIMKDHHIVIFLKDFQNPIYLTGHCDIQTNSIVIAKHTSKILYPLSSILSVIICYDKETADAIMEEWKNEKNN